MTGSSQPLVITDFLYRARDMFGAKQIIDHVDGVETMRYDYRTYTDRVLRLAAALVARGVRPGDRVGTLAWNHHRHLELYLAIPLAGAVLHTINIRLEADEIAYIVDHADDVLVFADPSLEHLLTTARQRRPDMAVVLLDDGEFEEIIAGAAPLDAPIRRDEDDLAALCYTSGTTGAPKGVGYRHKSLYLHTFAACLADGHAISERDRVLLVVPMFHANAWGVPFAAMMSGADQVLPGPHPSAPEIATIIATQRITYTGMVPTVAVDLVAHATRENIDLRSLRALVLGGSTPSTGLIRDIVCPSCGAWSASRTDPPSTQTRCMPICARTSRAGGYRTGCSWWTRCPAPASANWTNARYGSRRPGFCGNPQTPIHSPFPRRPPIPSVSFMKFSVFYVLESPDRDFRRAYDEMLEQIRIAESLGFGEVWLAEHHGSDYGSIPSPQIAAAAIAAHTERMRIGIAVSNLTFDWPVRVAEDYAMVDVLSGGRLDLGVGRGYQPHEFRAMGTQDLQGVSREVFDEALQIISGLWTKPVGEPYTFVGNHFQVIEADCRPAVVQQPTPPLYVASISPETFDLVAEGGHNMLVTPTLMTLPELNSFVVRAKQALLDRGRDLASLDFPMNWQIHLAGDEHTAVQRSREPLRWYFETVMSAIPHGPDTPGYERYAELAAAADEGAMSIDGLREGGVCYVGDPEGLVREIEVLRAETGLDHLICWMRFGGMAHEHVVESMELLAEHVMPVFADAPPVIARTLSQHSHPFGHNGFDADVLDTPYPDPHPHREGATHELSRR